METKQKSSKKKRILCWKCFSPAMPESHVIRLLLIEFSAIAELCDEFFDDMAILLLEPMLSSSSSKYIFVFRKWGLQYMHARTQCFQTEKKWNIVF